MSQAVSERFREFGIRMALGAQRRAVVGLIVRDALGIVALGVPLGVLGALGVTRLLGSLLFGVVPHDPATYATVLAGLVALVLIASLMPARRATRANPVDTLRDA